MYCDDCKFVGLEAVCKGVDMHWVNSEFKVYSCNKKRKIKTFPKLMQCTIDDALVWFTSSGTGSTIRSGECTEYQSSSGWLMSQFIDTDKKIEVVVVG